MGEAPVLGAENCWEINGNCECNGRNPEDTNCPSYRSQINCWDFDWLDFYETLPASQQEFWSHEFGKCTGCPAFKRFNIETKTDIIMLKEHYPCD
jgi:hypothetical protein